jgi:hypothetical protein
MIVTILVSWKFRNKIGLRYLSSWTIVSTMKQPLQRSCRLDHCQQRSQQNVRFSSCPWCFCDRLRKSFSVPFTKLIGTAIVPIVVTAWMNLATVIRDVSFLTFVVQGRALVNYGTFLGLAWAMLRIVIVSCL